jgi:hypothetical protein
VNIRRYYTDNLHSKLHVTMLHCSMLCYAVHSAMCSGEGRGVRLIGIFGVLGVMYGIHSVNSGMCSG